MGGFDHSAKILILFIIFSAAHEIGHLLGFGHSSNTLSMMYPEYKSRLKDLQFHQEDIEAIQYLYGEPGSVNKQLKLRGRHRH